MTTSRRRFVELTAAGLAAASAGPLTATAAALQRPSAGRDRQIFRFALQLETLQAAFYADAVQRGRLRGELAQFAETVSGHESAHVAAVAKAAGTSEARAHFDFRGATSDGRRFATAARLLEDLGVRAYNGEIANLTAPAMTLALEIVSVEGRHAAWIRDIVGAPPAPQPVDPGETAAAVAAAINSLGFRKR